MATKAKTKSKNPQKKDRKPPQLSATEQKEFQKRTKALVEEIKERRHAFEQKKAAAKSAKEMLAGSIAELERVSYEYTHPEAMPLFCNHTNGQAQANCKPSVFPVPDDDAWKATPIRDALPMLGKKVFEGMEKAQLDTIGKLIDWKNDAKYANGRFWTDIDGVGKAACDKLDDAIEVFFAKLNKERVKAAAEKVGEPDEAKGD